MKGNHMIPCSLKSRDGAIALIALSALMMFFAGSPAHAWPTASLNDFKVWDYDVKTDGTIRTASSGTTIITKQIELPGRMYVPSTYASGTSFALVLYFHGSGDQYTYVSAGTSGTQSKMDAQIIGSGTKANNNTNIDNLMVSATSRQFFLYAPQDPDQFAWDYTNIVRAMAMVKQAQKEYPKIDSHKIYVIGLSLGGRGCRSTVANFADLIAAAVPICSDMGDGEQGFYQDLVNKPIWAFAARDDASVPVSASRNLVKWIRQAAGKGYPYSWPISNGTNNAYANFGYPYFTGSNQTSGTTSTSGTTQYVTTHLSWKVWPTETINVSAFDTDTLFYTEFATGGHSIWSKVFSEGIPNYTGGGSNSKKYPLYDWLLSRNLDATLPAALQDGKTLLFDFGGSNVCPLKDGTTPGYYWNGTVAGDEQTMGIGATGSNNRAVFPYAINSEGKRTPVAMELYGVFGGTYTNGYSGAGAPYSSGTISGDGWLTKAFATSSSNAGILHFSGLSANAPYEVKIWASGTTADVSGTITYSRATRYEIGAQTQDLDVDGNINTKVTFTSVCADANGCMDVKVYPKPGVNARYGHIGALELKALTGGSDTTPPSVVITSPTNAATYATTGTAVALAGTASDDVGVSGVSWSNDRGGNGIAAGTTSWSVAGITLLPGVNVLTVTGTDLAGNTSTDTLTVTSNQPPVAVGEGYSIAEGTSGYLAVLGNDSDPDSWPQPSPTLDSVTPAVNGTAYKSGNLVYYAPTAGVHDIVEPVSYTITDGTAQATAIVSCTVVSTAVYNNLTTAGLTGTHIGINAGGSSRVLLGGTDWEVNGSGGGIDGTADSFHFEGADLVGDFQVIVKVKSLVSAGTTPRAGIMLRESNSPDARMAYISTTAGTNYKYGSRTTVGGTPSESTPSDTYTYPEAWMMLQRDGDSVRLYVSTSGTFSQVGTVTLTALSGTVKAGVFSSSGTSGVNARAVMSNYEESMLPIFDQDFGSSTYYTAYYNASTPTADQFNDIGTETGGGTWSIANGRLQIARAGISGGTNGAGFTRFTDFAGPPSVLCMTCDFGVTVNQSQSGVMNLEFSKLTGTQDYNNTTPSTNVFANIGVNAQGSSTFKLTVSGSTAAPTYSGNGVVYPLAIYLNKSGTAQSYRGPDGQPQTLNSNAVSLWVSGSAALLNIPASNGATSALTDMRVRFPQTDSGTYFFDNIMIYKCLPQ